MRRWRFRRRGPGRLTSVRGVGRRRTGRARLLLGRAMTVLTAAGLVVAFGIAALAPMGMSLAGALLRIDPTLLLRLHATLLRHASEHVWQVAVVPFLVRPAWVLPVMLSLVCGGIAITLGERAPHRR